MSERMDKQGYQDTDANINWICKICKDLPHYANEYLRQWEKEKVKGNNNEITQRIGIIQLKYYYALLHLLDGDDNEAVDECAGYPVIGRSCDFAKVEKNVVIAIGNAKIRSRI